MPTITSAAAKYSAVQLGEYATAVALDLQSQYMDKKKVGTAMTKGQVAYWRPDGTGWDIHATGNVRGPFAVVYVDAIASDTKVSLQRIPAPGVKMSLKSDGIIPPQSDCILGALGKVKLAAGTEIQNKIVCKYVSHAGAEGDGETFATSTADLDVAYFELVGYGGGGA